MPAWWSERRYGLFVHNTVASVPAWAPIGQNAEWYRSHAGDDVDDVVLHPTPMVEVLAHHRDRWGHITTFDDFAELLTFENFDAEQWARLAVDAGMGYTVFVAKHHDGLCWWDAPNTDRTVLNAGPKRNVLAEYAAACERNDIVFGTYYSLLDWHDDRYPSSDYVDDIVHAHAHDLVDRYGSNVIWADGHWGHGSDTWRSDELVDRIRSSNPDAVFNDRWRSTSESSDGQLVTTFEYDAPDDIVAGPWELCRGIGLSFGLNRNERPEHHMSAFDIVALLTEVIAKGGNLLLNVGPDADGSIPEMQAAPLRDAGTWVRQYSDLIAHAVPWEKWGDDEVRYFLVDGALCAVDLCGRGHFDAIDHAHTAVTSVRRLVDGGPDNGGSSDAIDFTLDDSGLQLRLRRHGPGRRIFPATGSLVDVAVYQIELADTEQPGMLFESTSSAPIALSPLLASATPGDIVQLGDAVYAGPASVPDGVILRGLGPSRTRIDGNGDCALTVGRGARVEHLSVSGAADRVEWFPSPAIRLVEQFATVLGCHVDGHVMVDADDSLVRASRLIGLVSSGVDRVSLSRCQLRGNRWDVGISITGGASHEIDSCEIENHLCGIRLTDTTGAAVSGNNIESRWWGVHLERADGAHVHRNRVRNTMRAVNVDGGASVTVDGNAVFDGDSGCVLERGATGCAVSGNHWERCRVGLLAWEAPDVEHHDNHAIDLHEPDQAVRVDGP